MIAAAAPTDDLSFQIGTVAGEAATLNAMKFELNNLQVRQMKYVEMGGALGVDFVGRCTTTTAGTDFKLTFN